MKEFYESPKMKIFSCDIENGEMKITLNYDKQDKELESKLKESVFFHAKQLSIKYFDE